MAVPAETVTAAQTSANTITITEAGGVTTLTLSAIGVWVGGVFGARWKSKAELCGGLVLILMGCKILLEHLGILG